MARLPMGGTRPNSSQSQTNQIRRSNVSELGKIAIFKLLSYETFGQVAARDRYVPNYMMERIFSPLL